MTFNTKPRTLSFCVRGFAMHNAPSRVGKGQDVGVGLRPTLTIYFSKVMRLVSVNPVLAVNRYR